MTVHELDVSVSRDEDGAVIALAGELNSSAQGALDAAYAEAAADAPRQVVLDFTQADYINSTGIAVIVGLLAQARAQAIEVKARGLSDHYREIFEITRLSDFMTIEGNTHA
jgi:anti-anti-sigma factor